MLADCHSFVMTLGERCEDRGRTYQEGCANQCPRSCTDLWEHVQCLQGACHSGTLPTEIHTVHGLVGLAYTSSLMSVIIYPLLPEECHLSPPP